MTINPNIIKPKTSHFLKWPVEVWGMVCKLRDKRGKGVRSFKSFERGRGLLSRLLIIEETSYLLR